MTSQTRVDSAGRRLPSRRPLLCCITSRRRLANESLPTFLERAVAAGLDLIQIREPDLPAHELLAVAEKAVALAQGTFTRILLNDRLDVALAAGAAGVHLPSHGLPVAGVRRRYPNMLVGASTHNLDELQAAADLGADFVVFGPVFAPLSKENQTPPVGVDQLAEAARTVSIPVLALGGVTVENASACLDAGAAGLAGITLFQASRHLEETLKQLRELSQRPERQS